MCKNLLPKTSLTREHLEFQVIFLMTQKQTKLATFVITKKW